MKKLIIGTLLILSSTHAISGKDIKDEPSGFYIDEDVYDGKTQNAYHSQLMDKKAYSQHLLFAVDSILSDYCDPEKIGFQGGGLTSDDPTFQAFLDQQKKNKMEKQSFCLSIEGMPIGSVKKKLAIVDQYKDFTCNRNISSDVNKASEKMESGYKESYLANCLSNPKELTIKELLEYNGRMKMLNNYSEAISVTDGILGTLPPSGGAGGFNFGSSSEPAPGVFNFDQEKSNSEFDNITLEDALRPKAVRF
jgi:hypothetical protein